MPSMTSWPIRGRVILRKEGWRNALLKRDKSRQPDRILKMIAPFGAVGARNDFNLERMETISPGRAWRKYRSADHAWHLRSPFCRDRCAAFVRRGRQRRPGFVAACDRRQIVVRAARTGGHARPRISHLCNLFEGGRPGRGGAHDRPPRNLYERRRLNGGVIPGR